MELSRDRSQGNYQITSYEPGKITVNDQIYTQSIIISLTELIVWPPRSFSDLQFEHFQTILALRPEIVLLGTGQQQIFPAAHLLEAFAAQQIGVEIMNTAAACRTFNVLVAEGRNVVAGLLIAQ